MGGKASLILVLAFSVLFGMLGTQMLKSSNDATDSYVNYYIQTKAHSIASSAANIAANKLFKNKDWTTGYSDLKVDDGKTDVIIEKFGEFNQNRKITAIGKFGGQKDTVTVWLEPKNFAQFGNFYDAFGSVWAATGDTFSGPFHTNDFLNTFGDPVWLGFTSSLKGVKLYDKYSTAHLCGGFAQGVSIPLTFDAAPIQNAAQINGKIFQDGTNYIQVDLQFNSDSTVTYKQRTGTTGVWSAPVTKTLNTLAPNGVIYIKKGDIFIKGTLSGRATVMANKNGSGGIIHITDDLKYNKNPLIEPSMDMLGLVAQEQVQLDKANANVRGDVDIHASIYSQNRGLIVETSDIYNFPEYNQAYKMNIIGGVIGKKVEATAKYQLIAGKWVPIRGYSYVHKFDERFNTSVPPFFPLTNLFRVISWRE